MNHELTSWGHNCARTRKVVTFLDGFIETRETAFQIATP